MMCSEICEYQTASAPETLRCQKSRPKRGHSVLELRQAQPAAFSPRDFRQRLKLFSASGFCLAILPQIKILSWNKNK